MQVWTWHWVSGINLNSLFLEQDCAYIQALKEIDWLQSNGFNDQLIEIQETSWPVKQILGGGFRIDVCFQYWNFEGLQVHLCYRGQLSPECHKRGVNLHKLAQGFPYLHTSNCTSPFHFQQANTMSTPLHHDPQTWPSKYICKHQHRHKHRYAAQLIKTALLDSSATIHFYNPSNGLSIIGLFNKAVTVAFGQVANTFASALLLLMQLPLVLHMYIVPTLSNNSLLRVRNFADTECFFCFPHWQQRGNSAWLQWWNYD